MKARTVQKPGGTLEAGEVDVHAEDPGDQRQRHQDHRHDRQHAEDVVLAVRDNRLVRVLPCKQHGHVQRVGEAEQNCSTGD